MTATLRCKDTGRFRLATLASDCFGLSSFHSNNLTGGAHRFLVVAIVVVGHFALVDAGADAEPFLYGARFSFLFASSTVVLLLQFIRQEAVEKCHRSCLQLPPVPVVRRLLLHFALSITHFLVYQLFYPAAILQNLFYTLLLFFIVQLPSIQFGYMMASVREGIRLVNRELEPFLLDESNRHLFSTKKSMKKEMWRIHEEYIILRDLCDGLVSTYSHQVLVMLALFSLEILFILQITFFDILKGNHVLDSNLDFSLRTYLLLSYLYKLCDVITPGQNYLQECTRTETILCNIKNLRSGEDSEVRQFILHKIVEPSQVSILGLFQLDYRLLYAIGCAAINYGLIIGMFHLGGLKKHDGFY